MKTISLAAALLTGGAAQAADAPATPAANICLPANQIDRTSVPDENTIVFHMYGGKTWVNKLMGHCPGLKFHGFAYEVTGGNQICGNLQSIRVIDTGAVCLLGPFTPGEPARKPSN